MRIPIRRLDPGLPLPAAQHDGDAGLDLYAAADVELEPRGGRSLVPTGIAIAIPAGYAGFVQPRSGLALRHGVTCLNTPGLIDAGYRDEIRVLLVNLDPAEPFKVSRGDRIAQLVVQRFEPVEWDEITDLDDSERPIGLGINGLTRIGSRLVHDRKFRFAVIAPKCGSGKELTERARKAEALGYSAFFVPDHFIEHDLAPTVALTHVAAVTDTLRVGPLVLGNDYKHPVVLARELATLDLLSDGRLELGIGAGWMTADYEKAGIPLDRPGVRIARLAESITVLKGLFAEGPFTFQGEHYQVTDLDGMPKPIQRPCPPFLIGGGGKKILALAAKEAQIVGINANLRSGDGVSRETSQSLIPAATDQKLAWLREAAGAGFDDLEIQSLLGFAHVTDDAAGIVKAIADSFGVSEEDAVLAPATLVGSIDSITELLERRRERWQMSYIVVPVEATETLAPVVARLAGK